MSRNLRHYVGLEARQIVGRLRLAGLAFAAMCLLVDQLIFPLLPPLGIALLQRAFGLHCLGEVILLNDFTGCYMAMYFVGVAQLWGVVIGPRDELHLELLLAKPVPPALFLAARVVPILASTFVVGLLLAAGCALGGWTHGLAPAAIMLYRPDLLVGRQALLDWIALLPTLIWHAPAMPAVAALAIAAAGDRRRRRPHLASDPRRGLAAGAPRDPLSARPVQGSGPRARTGSCLPRHEFACDRANSSLKRLLVGSNVLARR